MEKSIGRSSDEASRVSSGNACRTTIRLDAYQPLSTADRKVQLFGAGSAEQSGWPGLTIACPVVVSYH
jgi:hypothetical protein